MAPTPPPKTYDFDRGMKLFAERKFHAALAEFRGVSAQDPTHGQARFQVGRILLEALQAEEAIGWFAQGAELTPESAAIWQAWAEAVALGGVEQDRQVFLAALKDAPIKPELRLQLQDRFGARRKSSRPATGGLSKGAISALARGMEKGAFSKVADQAAKALKNHPKSAVAAFFTAEALTRLGRRDEAFAMYQKAVKLDPLYTEAYAATGQLLISADQTAKAVNAFRPAVILAPDMVPALIGLARALVAAHNFRPAIVLLQRAVGLTPRDGVLRTGLADTWKRLGDHARAVEFYEEARDLYKGKEPPLSLQLALVDARSTIGQVDLALSEVNAVLEQHPDHVAALLSKASIIQTEGDFEAASALLRRVNTLAPDNGEAYRRLVTGTKIKPGDPVLAEMEAALARDPGSEDRMNLGFALSKALEDVREDDRVFAYLNPANEIAAAMSRTSEAQLFFEVEQTLDAFGQIGFSDVAPIEANTYAPIFVTGLPRSGTTLIEQIIAAHSSMESGGELGIAKPLCSAMRTVLPGDARAADSVDALAEVGRAYEAAIDTRFPGLPRVTDKSINTFLALGPLKLAMPQARFIVVRRDPRDNLLSIYKNKFSEGTHGYANNLVSLARYYDAFDRVIAFWRERVPDWFYEVSYDALVADPEVEARKLIAACGLEWEDGCLDFHKTASNVRTLSVYQVRQPISKGSLKGWKRFERDLEPMIAQLRKDGHVAD